MNATDLAVQLAKAAPGAEVRIGAGEFEGPWSIDNPVRLVGVGPATVLWSQHGPTLTIRAPGVQLEGVSIEVSENAKDVALVLEGAARVQPPAFKKVRVVGAIAGLGSALSWSPPAVIDLGPVPQDSTLRKSLSFDAPDRITISATLAGLQVNAQPVAGGRCALQMTFSGQGLLPGSVLEGQVELEISGLSCPTRVIGRIELPGTHPIQKAEEETEPAEGSAADLLGGRQSRNPPKGAGAVVRPRPQGDVYRPPARQPPPPAPLPTPATASEPASNDIPWTEFLQSEARRSAESGDSERAIELLTQILQLQPDMPGAHADLAQLYARRGYIDGAVGEWEKVFGLKPEFPNVQVEIARCYNQLGRYADVVKLLERATKKPLGSRPVDVYEALAMAYYHLSRLDEALWALDQVIALNPNDAKKKALRMVWNRQR